MPMSWGLWGHRMGGLHKQRALFPPLATNLLSPTTSDRVGPSFPREPEDTAFLGVLREGAPCSMGQKGDI